MTQPTVTLLTLLVLLFALSGGTALRAEDRPQWGERHSRNMVSDEKGLPESFDAGQRDAESGEIDRATTENVQWVVPLGRRTYGSPVVAEGRVFIGTNNEVPRDPRVEGDRGVLMCFDERSGDFLWQLAVPKIDWIKFFDSPMAGITSPPTVEDGRVYVVSNRCEVMCLDVDGMADGNDGPYTEEGRHMVPEGQPPLVPGPQDADVLWCYDMVGELGVRCHDSSNCSILIDGDLLYVGTGNGLDTEHAKVAKPDAPTLIALDKNSGKLVARDGFGVGLDVIHGQWSSPALGRVAGKTRIFHGAGNGRLYGFDPVDPSATEGRVGRIEPKWSFNGQPELQSGDSVPFEPGRGSTSYAVLATPVFYENRIYASFTHDPWLGKKEGWLACLDATGQGDVTRSALVWSYPQISDCLATVSIADGLVYLADKSGGVHCLDAETGKRYWRHEAGGEVWGSTLVADGKVYLGTNRLVFWILAAGKQLEVIARIRLRDPVFSTPVAANGVLYVATHRHLYAIGGWAGE